MRVTMVNKYYPPHLGGIEFVMRDLAEGLVEHEGVSVRALVCAGGPRGAEENVNGVDVVRLPRAFEYARTPVSWGFAAALRDEERRDPAPDVLHFHFPYPWGEIACLQAKPTLPVVVTYHSDIVRQKAQLAVYRPMLERFLDRADVIIASSPNMIEHSEFLSARSEKCRVVNFGIHAERYADRPEVLARAGELRAAHAGRRIVLFVGRLVYYKGADVLVRAFAGVDADADLVLVGEGPLEGELREIATANGTASRISFIPPVGDDELAAWYHAADVFVLPSVARSEAFGLVQIEAHAAGTPVVSTDLPTGVPHANLDGVTGLTVRVGDETQLAGAINRLLGDEEFRARLGAQARERATTEFTIPAMAANTVAVYREAAGMRAGGRT
jgi:rhamnosyl/mannosyltransferase